MSILHNLPHRCRIELIGRADDSMGGSLEVPTVVADDVHCWVQPASSNEQMLFEKRGMDVTRKIFFTFNPQLTEQHQIIITRYPNPATVYESNPLTVLSFPKDDASAGLGLLWRVMVGEQTAEFA